MKAWKSLVIAFVAFASSLAASAKAPNEPENPRAALAGRGFLIIQEVGPDDQRRRFKASIRKWEPGGKPGFLDYGPSIEIGDQQSVEPLPAGRYEIGVQVSGGRNREMVFDGGRIYHDRRGEGADARCQ